MKRLKFRFLLPMVAFMFAIAAAFATQTDGQEDFAPVQGYIYQNGVCVPNGTCSNNKAAICTDNLGRIVFGLGGPTGCTQRLNMDWHP